MNSRRSRESAFTLIELLVVISIIGLLASIVLAALQGARQKGYVAAGETFADNVYHTLGVNAFGMWGFNEGSGNSTNDSSINGDTLNLGTGVTWTSGIQGNALAFNGSGGLTLATAPNASLSQMSNNLTVTAWVYLNQDERGSIFGDYVTGSTNFNFGVDCQPGNTGCGAITAPFSLEVYYPLCYVSHTNGNVLSAGKWYMVGYTKNGPNDPGTFYVNGQSTPTVSNASCGGNSSFGPFTASQNDPLIGIRKDGQAAFNGDIDEVRVYNQTLADDQIYQLYAEGAASHGLALK